MEICLSGKVGTIENLKPDLNMYFPWCISERISLGVFQSVHEAQLLALQVKMYYGPQSGLEFNLVRVMNNAPHQFRHMDLVKEFENLKKDYKEAAEHKQ